MVKPRVHLVWFKRDLRVVDHEPICRAAERGPVLPLYVVEPGLWRQADTAERHWAFTSESLLALRDALATLGQPLVVRVGEITRVLETLQRSVVIDAVWSHEETGNYWTYRRDERVRDFGRNLGIVWHEMPEYGVVRRPADLFVIGCLSLRGLLTAGFIRPGKWTGTINAQAIVSSTMIIHHPLLTTRQQPRLPGSGWPACGVVPHGRKGRRFCSGMAVAEADCVRVPDGNTGARRQ